MKPHRVGISNFRSIGEEFVHIDLTKKINVLVGANNCGKSSVVSSLMHLKAQGGPGYLDSDYHGLSKHPEPVFRFSGEVEFQSGGSLAAYFDFEVKRRTCVATSWDSMDQSDFDNLLQRMSGRRIGRIVLADELKDYKLRKGNDIAMAAISNIPKAVLVPEFRKIESGEEYKIGGSGIVELLASWDRPDFGKRKDQTKIHQIRGLLRSLIQRNDAEIEVSRKSSQILVTIGSLQLPLSSYGTGIHELVILAIAVLSHENTLVCIEEPEIHLHPLLQRRFLDFLRKETTNRYVITTHSPALIAPNDDTAVIHLWLENGVTKSRLVETNGHSLEALRDLGAKASDLLQANSVIWVEGPSDRIYLNGWLTLLHPELREGIDYSIMFYGGRLLSHLSLEREDHEEAADLVRLLRINQHSAILIDSDRRAKNSSLNATKQRVIAECKEAKIPCWVTEGREIENYLPVEAIAAAYAELAQSKPVLVFRKFDSIEAALKKAFRSSWKRAHYYDESKPQMARLIVARLTKEQLTPELTAWVGKLVRVIRHEAP